jgi:transposase
VPKDHPVRFVADLVDALDLRALKFRQSPGEEGRPHYAPELLLGVWLYGWMERIRSTRALEKACCRDFAFVWLTSNLQPDHNSLWRFFRDNKKVLKKLFVRVVRMAADAGLVGFALHALDGTKLQVQSSMESALHKKALTEELEKLEQIVDQSADAIEAQEQQPSPEWRMPPTLADREERKKVIREQLAKLDEVDRSHLHPNEPDARVMKTRGGPRLAYNAQVVVDHDSDMIVAAEVCGEETDYAQLVPMVEQVRDTLGRVAEHSVADAGYASGAQFEEAQKRHLPVVVAVQDESSGKDEYAKSRFTYDAVNNAYICPRGEVLAFERVEKPTTGKPQPRHVYRCHNGDCPVRGECTKDKAGRAIKRLDTEQAYERQAALQREPAMRILLELRKEIVEHIFGIAKAVDGFWRFTVRGLEGARAQWALVCTAINLRKMFSAWRSGSLRLAAA